MVAVPQGFRKVTGTGVQGIGYAAPQAVSGRDALPLAIRNTSAQLGIDPVDFATAIGYETSGTYDPWKKGPTTRWGQHRGFIQWGEPQAQQYGVYEGMPVDEQIAAAGRYLKDSGVKPGMGREDIYSAINAGQVGRPNASDRPGYTVRRHVASMGGYEPQARQMVEFANAETPQATAPATTGGAKIPPGFRRVQGATPAPVRKPDGSMGISTGSNVTVAPKGQAPRNLPPETQASSIPSVDDALGFMTGYTRSLVGQGMGAGYGDEAEAGIRAAIAKAQGDERPFGDIYGEQLETIRGEQKQFGEEHPAISTGTEIAGALGTAALTRGKSAPASLANLSGRSALVGGGYGGLYGFGTGEGAEDRLSRAKWGAGVGAGAGLAAPLAVAGAQAVASPLASLTRGLVNPGLEAGRRVAGAIAKDRRLGQGLTPQQVAMARREGQPIANIDLGGENTRTLARGAATLSPEARSGINRTIDDRFEGQSERINTWLRDKTGFSGDASATRDALLDQARKANKPAYARAYGEGNKGLWSPELERLSGSPDVLGAMKAATSTGKSRAINDGFGAFNPGVQVTNDGRLIFTKGPKGTPTYPNLQYWDYVKRELDGAIGRASRAGDAEAASRLRGQAELLRNELDRLVPSYKAARSGAANFFDADDALEAGQKFINLNVDIREARRALAKMTPAERQLFSEGFVSSLMDKVTRVPDRANVVRRIWESPKAREQIMLALGPAKAKEFETFMSIEAVMNAGRDAVQRYPGAARQLIEMGVAGAGTGIYTGDPLTGIVTALTYGAGRKGLAVANTRVAQSIGKMLISSDPQIYRRGLQAVSKSKAMSTSLRYYIGALAGVSAGQQASGETE